MNDTTIELTDKKGKDKANEVMKATVNPLFKTSPRVTVRIPTSEKEREAIAAGKSVLPVVVVINGVSVEVPKGVSVEVPKCVEEILSKAYKI